MEEQLIITGGKQLIGEINISGSKNATLACLAGTLLTDDPIMIENVPNIKDIEIMNKILVELGSKIKPEIFTKKIKIIKSSINKSEISSNLSNQIRGSLFLIGGILSRTGYCKISKFGGCPIGQRPINLHLKALKLLGARVNQSEEYIEIFSEKLKGNEIYLDFSSVGATINTIIAASLADGKSLIKNIALEPEIINLIEMLIKMGANIKLNLAKRQIKVIGNEKLTGTQHRIIPDRIEAGTYAIAASITNGDILLKNVNIDHMGSINLALKKMGVDIETKNNDSIHLHPSGGNIKSIEIETQIYPGFPTDMQPQLTSLATQALGTSKIVESIYDNRFHHVQELNRMGANIKVFGREIIVKGNVNLIGKNVNVKDIRGGASLVLAALRAKGTTFIHNIGQIFRGYEHIVQKLKNVGADIKVNNEN